MREKIPLRLTGAVAIALVLSFFNAGCSKDAPTKPTATGKEKPAQAQGVTIVRVEGRTVERSVESTGTLMGRDEAVVSNESPGIVGRIHADLGDAVMAGGTLATLDQREAKLNLAGAEAVKSTNHARYVDAKASLARYDELFKQGMISQSQYDGVKTQYDVAAAQVEDAAARLALARKRLSDTVISAPIDGAVSKRFVSVGEAVRDRTPMFTIVSSGALKYRGTVAEVSAPEVKIGQKVGIKVDAFRGREFVGTITRISPAVNAETRTLEIEASVPNPDGLLKPGFFASGVVFTKMDENVPFAPDAAVYSFVGITKVFVVEGGVARERMVRLGTRDGDMVELIGRDIKPGDTVAAANLSNLYDGALVPAAGKQ